MGAIGSTCNLMVRSLACQLASYLLMNLSISPLMVADSVLIFAIFYVSVPVVSVSKTSALETHYLTASSELTSSERTKFDVYFSALL